MNVKANRSSYDVDSISSNLNLQSLDPALLKKFMIAAVIDLVTFSPEIISKTLGLDTESRTVLDDTKLSMKIADTLSNTNSRQSCVVNLVKSNPELVSYLVRPVYEKVAEQSIVKLGQASYNFVKGKLFSSDDKKIDAKPKFTNKIKDERKNSKVSSKTI